MQKCIFKASAGASRSWLRAGIGTPALLLGCPLSREPGQPLSCLVLAAPWAFWALFGERAGVHFQDLCPAGWLQVLATRRHGKGRAQTCSRLSPFLLQNVWQPWSHRMLWSCPDKIHLKITDFFIKVRSITDPTLSPSLPPWLLASNYSRRKWDKGRIWLVSDCTGTWKKSSHPPLFSYFHLQMMSSFYIQRPSHFKGAEQAKWCPSTECHPMHRYTHSAVAQN